MKADVLTHLNLDLPVDEWAKEEGIADEEIRERLVKAADEDYAARTERNTAELQRYIEKQVVLERLDHLWREHIVTLDHLRNVIGWRGMAQRDPLNEYKSEAFQLFEELTTRLRESVTGQLMRIDVMFQEPTPPAEEQMSYSGPAELSAATTFAATPVVDGPERDPNDPTTWGKVGRNESCPAAQARSSSIATGSLLEVRSLRAGGFRPPPAARSAFRPSRSSPGRARPRSGACGQAIRRR